MSTLDQYRQAKSSISQLETAAKKELIARFHSLVAEVFAIQKELLDEFGVKVAIPKKAPTKPRNRAPHPNAKLIRAAERHAEIFPPTDVKSGPVTSPKIRALERKLATQRKKLVATNDPKSSKAVQDRIYELEDEIRLEREKA